MGQTGTDLLARFSMVGCGGGVASHSKRAETSPRAAHDCCRGRALGALEMFGKARRLDGRTNVSPPRYGHLPPAANSKPSSDRVLLGLHHLLDLARASVGSGRTTGQRRVGETGSQCSAQTAFTAENSADRCVGGVGRSRFYLGVALADPLTHRAVHSDTRVAQGRR